MTKALVVEHLSKTYSNGFRALKSVSFNVEQGEFFALLGPNGAGKSTLIGILTSLIKKTEGNVWINGINIDDDFSTAKKHLGVVPQEFNFDIFATVESIILDQAGYFGIPHKTARIRAEKYLRQLELWDKRHERARFLSGGMKRRVMIVRSLIHNPKVLILDEPTAGVDIEVRRTMWDFLRKLNADGVTIILTTHYLEEAEMLCRHVGIIDSGQLIENAPMNIILDKLETESFILYLEKPMPSLPVNFQYPLKLIDSTTIEVEIPKDHDVTHLFLLLKQQGYTVLRLRNKMNRLEELFIQMTKNELDE